MKRMTYGTFPSREEFDKHLLEVCQSDNFRFGNDPRVGNSTLDKDELWNELNKAMEEGDEDWCSCVMSALDFEWV